MTTSTDKPKITRRAKAQRRLHPYVRKVMKTIDVENNAPRLSVTDKAGRVAEIIACDVVKKLLATSTSLMRHNGTDIALSKHTLGPLLLESSLEAVLPPDLVYRYRIEAMRAVNAYSASMS